MAVNFPSNFYVNLDANASTDPIVRTVVNQYKSPIVPLKSCERLSRN